MPSRLKEKKRVPLQLDPTDPQRTDPRTGAAVTYVRIDSLHLFSAKDRSPEVVIRIGLYTAAPEPGRSPAYERVREREIRLTLNQAQTLVDLVDDRIYTALSGPTGPFPNATIVA